MTQHARLAGLLRYWRASELHALGRARSVASNEPRDRARALRLFRKALRVSGAVAAAEIPDADVEHELELVLDATSPWRIARRHRQSLLRAVLAISLVGSIGFSAWSRFQRTWGNLAFGRPFYASSAWAPFPSEGVVSHDSPLLFHTQQESSPSVTVDLGSVISVQSVDVENRSDCCQDRAFPLIVEVSEDGFHFGEVRRLLGVFDTHADFAPARARFVRLRVDRTSILHLRSITVS